MISQYSKCLNNYLFNYQIIKNLDNIDNFTFDEKYDLKEDDSFVDKTQKFMDIFEGFNDINKNKIRIIKNYKKNETTFFYHKFTPYIFKFGIIF